MDKVFHSIGPVYNKLSRILILGTMPSPKSREAGFYYSHPQNRFWRALAELYAVEIPVTAAEKRAFVLSRGIALWDVLRSCDIKGADDSSIKNPDANDLSLILRYSPITAIFTTGQKAAKYYEKLCLPHTNIKAHSLPSTSPANCRLPFAELVKAFSIILP